MDNVTLAFFGLFFIRAVCCLLLLFSACLDVLLAIELSFLGLVCMDCMNFRWSVQWNLIEKEIKYSYTFAS